MAYLDQPQALAAIKELPAVRSLPSAPDDQFLNDLLTASAGTVRSPGKIRNGVSYLTGATVYRHYFVAARYLEILRSQHVLAKGSGAEFTGLKVPIASLMALQQGDDLSLDLEVPLGYEPVAVAAAGAGSAIARPIGNSGSRRTKVTP
jgi:hypothetical protein